MKLFLVVLTGFLVGYSSISQADARSDFEKSMSSIMTNYLKIQRHLANDSFSGITKDANRIYRKAKRLDVSEIDGDESFVFYNIKKDTIRFAKRLRRAKSILDARSIFAKLSEPIIAFTNLADKKTLDVKYCPMKKSGWVQKRGTTRNPYYGQSMLTCGSNA